jgi:hypothetical protein
MCFLAAITFLKKGIFICPFFLPVLNADRNIFPDICLFLLAVSSADPQAAYFSNFPISHRISAAFAGR